MKNFDSFIHENSFPKTAEISRIKDPLDYTEEKTALFIESCKEMAIFHYENNKVIKDLYNKYNFSPYNDLNTKDDLEKIPSIGVTAMKYHLIHTLPEESSALKLTSSGTKGQKTQIWFDQGSLDRVQKMLDVYLEQEKIVSKELQNYIVFSYDPEDAKDLGVAYSEKNQLRFAPVNKVHYLVKKDPHTNEWKFDKDFALKILQEYEAEGLPLRLFGMPAFIYDFILYLEKLNIKFNFPKTSWMISGGGWKASEDKKISREEFRKLCSDFFGIPLENIRDAYGMAEHSAPYFHCKFHRFHIPVYNHLIIRDPETLKPVPDGQKGLLELITPFNAIMPTLSLLSTDWAIINSEKCPCGYNSPTFELLGRAGNAKHKGCAIHAEDIIKKKKD